MESPPLSPPAVTDQFPSLLYTHSKQSSSSKGRKRQRLARASSPKATSLLGGHSTTAALPQLRNTGLDEPTETGAILHLDLIALSAETQVFFLQRLQILQLREPKQLPDPC